MKDTQCTKAILSFCAIDASTGKVLYEQNSSALLPPASTLKTFTTGAALYYLQPEFRYKTDFLFQGRISGDTAYGNLIIIARGDPTLGSDRFPETSAGKVFDQLDRALNDKGIRWIKGHVLFPEEIPHDTSRSSFWLEEDYGNYYGAGVYNFNWKENKLEITLSPTKHGFVVTDNDAGLDNEKDFCIQLTPKEGSSTEEAFAFLELTHPCRYCIKGSLTPSNGKQTLSLASLDPKELFIHDLKQYFGRRFQEVADTSNKEKTTWPLLTWTSPSLKEMVYACNQKSLNLYAETFCKTIGYKMNGVRSWKSGLKGMSTFATALKVKAGKIQLKDGSGLSPSNKITTLTLATLLFRYRSQPWWSDFFPSVPLIHDFSMKSGYIGGTRSYAGYTKLKSGQEVAFAFIVHGYSGSAKLVKEKMFKVLDTLKQ